MTFAQRNAIVNPATGLTIFQTDVVTGLYYNSGTPAVPVWQLVGNNAGQWLNNGSTIYYNNGYVGIGTDTPLRKLHVDGYYYLSNSTDYPFIFMDLNNSFASGHCGLTFLYNSLYKAWIYYDNGDNLLRLSAENGPGFRNDMVITNAGSVGIGTQTLLPACMW
ncbi:MAG: hypothetical protein IPH84_16035 [Bacteroidales bacterium]|nr:hypothetical protein [Bacteroidales bacterium]